MEGKKQEPSQTGWLLLTVSSGLFPQGSAVENFSGCGGMILVANALRMTKLKNPPVIDLIPAMILIFPITWLWMCIF